MINQKEFIAFRAPIDQKNFDRKVLLTLKLISIGIVAAFPVYQILHLVNFLIDGGPLFRVLANPMLIAMISIPMVGFSGLFWIRYKPRSRTLRILLPIAQGLLEEYREDEIMQRSAIMAYSLLAVFLKSGSPLAVPSADYVPKSQSTFDLEAAILVVYCHAFLMFESSMRLRRQTDSVYLPLPPIKFVHDRELMRLQVEESCNYLKWPQSTKIAGLALIFSQSVQKAFSPQEEVDLNQPSRQDQEVIKVVLNLYEFFYRKHYEIRKHVAMSIY
ncbi:MAG: hypothetical protein ACXIUL_06630 [Wenzhouxiangella sp.]